MSSLVTMFLHDPGAFETKSIGQIIKWAGDGDILHNVTSIQVREFLREPKSALIYQYIEECLTNKIEQGGYILQDLINEIGRRLGFEVIPGLYKGVHGKNGFDGLWKSDSGFSIVVETKTTDAYRINLDTLDGYRRQVYENGKQEEQNISVLIVVGRQDTGDLEAQIRGSRHAWRNRLISADSLMELLRLKEEKIGNALIIKQIFEVLRPYEYTKIDKLIKLIFLSAYEPDETETEIGEQPEVGEIVDKRTLSSKAKFHAECAEKLSAVFQKKLSPSMKNLYATNDKNIGVQICVSRLHSSQKNQLFWFALHPYYFSNLQTYRNQYIAYGCGDASRIILLPVSFLADIKDRLWKTATENRMYWHIKIYENQGTYLLTLGVPHAAKINITEYLVKTAT